MSEINLTEAAETIVMLGAPGSGKDTQSQFLSDSLGYQIISSGELIRIRAGHDEDLKKLLARGELAPNEVVDDEIISVFALLPERKPVLMNGYPRTLEQAEKLDKILEENNRVVDKVLYIKVGDKELVKRIGKRRLCSKCGLFTSDEHSSCPDCDGKLILREDDKPESVKNRLAIFHKTTEPVIDYYRKHNLLVEVDGNPSVEEVKENIKRVL